ncbi:ABC transporter ATP-binding protein [Lacicoccus qingdaonensis]|uniref:Teichoic acid transport system ATP-binding protein n=1 Tax=Lacicoccus qingdaonensis TaxID=576118 RepID=A0A1G9H8R1_9BACL|nr:ABC transporter ATP-binding protein [Salinicoccus qingdaonensis]SDL08803.1 teichoic acid transport system ATP-binding protein [Salinicoccus qingdaonensis]
MTYKVKVENLSKVYDLNKDKISKIISLFTFGKIYKQKPFFALKDINFEVMSGDSVGILGLNGSGKTTLSDLLGEVTEPTAGNISIKGKSSLIAINAGLNQDLNGIENIKMKCLMHGLTEVEIEEKFEDIKDFSELGEFLEQPIKTYSSGMRAKLGFAIAIHTDPDVLIIDEALSVGDETFADKCLVKIKEFQEQGKTIFFVSHSASQVRNWCNKAVWIQYGEVEKFDEVDAVVDQYSEFVNQFKNLTKDEQLEYKEKMLTLQKEKSKHFKINKDEFSFFNMFIGLGFFSIFALGVYGQILSIL